MVTNQEVIDAYTATGSVWLAGKKIGISGQSVWERLKRLGYKMPSSEWTVAEIEELKLLASQMTIAQIANRLGRPYAGVAIKISRLGLGTNYGNRAQKKKPKGVTYSKPKVAEYIAEIEQQDIRISRYARMNSLSSQLLSEAIQRHFPEWYEAYSKANAFGPQKNCPYCEKPFWPTTGKHTYCTAKCADDARVDNAYFGGRRRETIGLLEGICQLCNQHTPKGLSSHHIRGKENDPENEHLIALCSGCHQIVTILAGRRFAATTAAWEVLIQLVLLRKNGHDPNYRDVYTSVKIRPILGDLEAL